MSFITNIKKKTNNQQSPTRERTKKSLNLLNHSMRQNYVCIFKIKALIHSRMNFQ